MWNLHNRDKEPEVVTDFEVALNVDTIEFP